MEKRSDTSMHQVYLAKADNGLFKIGLSSNACERIRGLNKQSPIDIKMVALYGSTDAIACENELHRWFRNKHVKGEWFYLTDEDVEVFHWYFEGVKNARKIPC